MEIINITIGILTIIFMILAIIFFSFAAINYLKEKNVRKIK